MWCCGVDRTITIALAATRMVFNSVDSVQDWRVHWEGGGNAMSASVRDTQSRTRWFPANMGTERCWFATLYTA